MKRSRKTWAGLMIALATLVLPVAGWATQAQAQASAPAIVTAGGTGATSATASTPTGALPRRYSPDPVTLPHKTYHRADGSVDVVADPAALAELAAATSTPLCGYVCDGKDPSSYKYDGATCSDARTVYTHDEGWAYAELRYSSRCGTAWTRTCCYVNAGGFGYNSSGVQRSWVSGVGVYSGVPIWTAMLYDYGTLKYKACFDRVVAGTPSDWACTAKY